MIESACEPFKSLFSVHCSPMGLVDVIPIVLQSQVTILKMGCLMWGKKLALREMLWVLNFFLIVDCCVEGGVYSEIVSPPFLLASVWFLSHLPV